jgi:hypothetical protein
MCIYPDSACTERKRSDTISLCKINSCRQAIITKYAGLKIIIYLCIDFKKLIDVFG